MGAIPMLDFLDRLETASKDVEDKQMFFNLILTIILIFFLFMLVLIPETQVQKWKKRQTLQTCLLFF